MKRILSLVAVTALVAACADDPVTDVVVDPGVDPVDPTEEDGALQRGDLKAASLNDNGELVVQITLDGGSDVAQNYGFDDDDFGPFLIYYRDEGQTGRLFTAIAGESKDSLASATVVSDGGQFNRFFGGAVVEQNEFSAPVDGGVTDYAGRYAGLLNFGEDDRNGVRDSESANAVRSFIVTGEIFLKADFTDGAVNGAIFNREYANGDLPEIVLVAGDLTDAGIFSGGVELTDLTPVGTYGGAFSGEGASSGAGLIELGAGFLGTTDMLDPTTGDPIEDPDNPGEFLQMDLGDGNEVEFGIFILEELPD